MNLNELSAEDLAAVDAICLEFEDCIRAKRSGSIEDHVNRFILQYEGTPGDELIGLLKTELVAIENEILSPPAATKPRKVVTPFQAKAPPTSENELQQKNVVSQSANLDRETASDEAVTLAVVPNSIQNPQANGRTDSNKPNSDLSAVVSRGEAKPSQREGDQFSIGPFSITSVLAKGGMGIVYRAEDTRLDRPVAIKMLGFPDLADDHPKRIELVERFEREAKAVAALSHPNIVELFDVGVESGSPYAVMEFLGGATLAEHLADKSISPQQTCEVGMQIASALATAHTSGVIHRDLKPQNVMVVESEEEDKLRVKLVDFGLSRVSDRDYEDDGSRHTRAGTILGTPGYMAPEQARGEPATESADMFALGCVLYEGLYGKPAIVGETAVDRLASTLRGEVVYEEAKCKPSIILCDVIKKCLQKDPALRPSAADVATKLRDFVNKQSREAAQSGEPPRADSWMKSSWSRRHAITAIAGGIVGGVVGGFSSKSSARYAKPVQSIAVLTPQDNDAKSSSSSDRSTKGNPLDDQKISDADILASMLVSELSKIDALEVRPYRPMAMTSTLDYVPFGNDLDVDVLIDGSFGQQERGQRLFWVFRWQVIDAANGSVIVDKEFVHEQQAAGSDGQFLVRSAVASEIAEQIGRKLTATGQLKSEKPDPHSYGCLVKGRAYADIDSTMGLEKALDCFKHAHMEDARRSEPLAAIAVTSLHLAARSAMPKAAEYLNLAIDSFTNALDLDPDSIDGRLARAMYEWQAQYDFELAGNLFDGLLLESDYDWQVQFQTGLFFAASDRESKAFDAIKRAAKLNPMSLVIKIERARIDWFFDYQSRAKRDVERYLDRTSQDYPARPYALGLLLDLYEEEARYEEAAKLMGRSLSSVVREEYYELRKGLLEEFPYGPFGSKLNEAIFLLRSDFKAIDDLPGQLDESGALMFPLLLAKHPAFAILKNSPAVAEILPVS